MCLLLVDTHVYIVTDRAEQTELVFIAAASELPVACTRFGTTFYHIPRDALPTG